MIVGGSFNYNLIKKHNIDSDDYQRRSAYIKHRDTDIILDSREFLQDNVASSQLIL